MSSPWFKPLLAVGVFVGALAPRLSTWAGTFGRPVVLLEEVDAYYHLRRIELALSNNLLLPAVDTYNNHPFGATVDWPPGFDLLFAFVWHVLSKITPDPASPAAVGAVGVAVLGSLAAAAVAVLGTRWGLWAGLAAGLSLAWSPAAVAYSRVGRLDHHAIEPLCLVLLLGTYAWSRGRASNLRAGILGAVLALATFFWVGAAFYAGVLALALALEAWSRGEEDPPAGAGVASPSRPAPAAPHGAVAYLTAAVISALLALSSPWGRNLEVVYYALSWFQPLVFGSLALALGIVAGLEGRGVDRERAWAFGGLTLVATAALTVLAGSGTVGRGLAFLLGRDIVAATLLESRSLMETGFAHALRWLTPVALAAPVLWIAAAALAVRRRLLDPLLAAVLALGIPAMAFALLQTRFGPHVALVSGLLTGWLVARVTRPLWAGGVVAAVAATLAWSVRPSTLPDSVVHPYVLGGFDALVWLRQKAPQTSHFFRPVQQPEYGVAAEWVWGHWITQVGRRPNIANPLGQTLRNLQGIDAVARLFLTESEPEALAEIDRLGIRYLLLSSIPVTISELAVQAGEDPARYVTRNPNGDDSFLRPFLDTFHSRLYLGGGAGEHGTAPVSGIRLVFESSVHIEFQGSRPAVRIFEAVPGATLRGRCRTDAVEGRAELEESGLVYTATGAPGPTGDFAMHMPYASERGGASIPARITVRCGDTEIPVQVSERDVLEGRDVGVPDA